MHKNKKNVYDATLGQKVYATYVKDSTCINHLQPFKEKKLRYIYIQMLLFNLAW